jgi:DNA (cytosine-5)-methyltransferase 1
LIGGFSLGLEWAGFETVALCEFDKKAQLVLKKHWPSVPIFDDVKELTFEKLR